MPFFSKKSVVCFKNRSNFKLRIITEADRETQYKLGEVHSNENLVGSEAGASVTGGYPVAGLGVGGSGKVQLQKSKQKVTAYSGQESNAPGLYHVEANGTVRIDLSDAAQRSKAGVQVHVYVRYDLHDGQYEDISVLRRVAYGGKTYELEEAKVIASIEDKLQELRAQKALAAQQRRNGQYAPSFDEDDLLAALEGWRLHDEGVESEDDDGVDAEDSGVGMDSDDITYYVAQHDFYSRAARDLSFREGDVLAVPDDQPPHLIGSGWVMANNIQSGEWGNAPIDYLEVIEDEEEDEEEEEDDDDAYEYLDTWFAIANFRAHADRDVSFVRGDTLLVPYPQPSELIGSGWVLAHNTRTGEWGNAPLRSMQLSRTHY